MIDLLLLLIAVIWGTNYSIVKSALREIDPHAFNAARMTIASAVFLSVILTLRLRPNAGGASGTDRADSIAAVFQTSARLNARDVAELAVLGFGGHFLYQYFFISGLALTTVANASLMLAATPVFIALINAVSGRERIGRRHWIGAVLSMLGIYIVVGRGAEFTGQGHALLGDLMMVVAVICWALYTVGARRLISRHSPVGVTGLSMAIGTLIYLPATWRHVSAVSWSQLSSRTWLAILYSSLMALCVSYTIWYAAVRQIGSARTSVYSNVIPIVAMAT